MLKGENRKIFSKNCDKSIHRPETKKEREVKILCNKPSQQKKSMKTNA
jgi:hypothetical protein